MAMCLQNMFTGISNPIVRWMHVIGKFSFVDRQEIKKQKFVKIVALFKI